jgi:hypothetical protein
MLVLLNFAHPITEEQCERIEAICQAAPQIRDLAAEADRDRPIAEVARELADAAGLSSDEWQSTPLLINPPALAPLALALIAEIHGRCGGFPAILNIRPIEASIPTRYEVAEVVNLQQLREQARSRRFDAEK